MRRRLILGMLLLLWQASLVCAQQALQLTFEDQDPRGGFLSGILELRDNSSERFEEYTLHWGSNPHTLLGQYQALATLKPLPRQPLQVRLEFRELRIPPGGTHLLVYSSTAAGNVQERLNWRIEDLGVPRERARALGFRQRVRSASRIEGELRLIPALNERDLMGYAVYWGADEDRVLRGSGPVVFIPKRSWYTSLWDSLKGPWSYPEQQIPLTLNKPAGATHLLAFSRNLEGQMNVATPFRLDFREILPEASLEWSVRLDSENRILREALILLQLKQSDYNHFQLCWGRSAEQQIELIPPLREFEARTLVDAVLPRQLEVTRDGPMEQDLKVGSSSRTTTELRYQLPGAAKAPPQATHLLLLAQRRFWFEDNIDTCHGRVLAATSLRPGANPEPHSARVEEPATGELNDLDNLEQGPSAPEWRMAQYRGVGVGLSFSQLNSLVFEGAYNVLPWGQVHLQLDYTGPTIQSAYSTLQLTGVAPDMANLTGSLSGNRLEVSRLMLGGSFRAFVPGAWTFDLTESLFAGAGLGYAQGTLDYSGKVSEITYPGGTPQAVQNVYQHRASGQGFFLAMELGWQGNEHYAFSLVAQPSFFLNWKDGYEPERVPEASGQRETVSGYWNRVKEINRVLVAVSVFF